MRNDKYPQPLPSRGTPASQGEGQSWSLPADVDSDDLRRGEYTWDAAVASLSEKQRKAFGSTSPRNIMPSLRTEDAVLQLAETWIREGRCCTREGDINLKQAAVLTVTAAWLQQVMNGIWLGDCKPPWTPQVSYVVVISYE